jgi:hypothetical protein
LALGVTCWCTEFSQLDAKRKSMRKSVGYLLNRELSRAWGVWADLMIERVDIVHIGEMQGIKVKWREVGWNALIAEFAPDSIGAELLEVEA